MSKRLLITETVDSEEELVDLLNEIATQIERGFTSGYYPHWEIVDEDD